MRIGTQNKKSEPEKGGTHWRVRTRSRLSSQPPEHRTPLAVRTGRSGAPGTAAHSCARRGGWTPALEHSSRCVTRATGTPAVRRRGNGCEGHRQRSAPPRTALSGGDGRPAKDPQHGAASDMRPAAALLQRISDAEGKRRPPSVRDDQFVYTREKVRETDLTSGKAEVGPLRLRETWLAQQQKPLHKLGLMRVDGETLPINAELGDTEGTPAGINRPTYRWLSSLPTDPDKLLDKLYAKTPQPKGAQPSRRDRDQAVFEQIGSLLGGMLPPRTGAALYRAAARIPGVTPAPEAHDALGRTGLGIARDDKRHGIRTEWVFDEKDFSFLGSRSYLTKNTSYAKAGGHCCRVRRSWNTPSSTRPAVGPAARTSRRPPATADRRPAAGLREAGVSSVTVSGGFYRELLAR
ncbi:CU044_5270 family protein [Streptomyces sp. CA-250714]|uniref:CU044_5270 family protein n=1 Tax=Streptomyces sp. CA-250714 TaxID=3240060 RepID=UPI003D949613